MTSGGRISSKSGIFEQDLVQTGTDSSYASAKLIDAFELKPTETKKTATLIC